MLLTIDVGNTTIALGILDGDEVIGRYRLVTKSERTSDEFGFFILNFIQQCNLKKEDIEDVVISSVVPKVMYALNSSIIKYFDKTPIIIDAFSDTGIDVIAYDKSEVGADRIVNCAYGYHTYHNSAIIVDFGTATTFDYVSDEGEFKYVIIMPGIQISLNALSDNAAKLPEIEIKKPDSILGVSTVSGMQAGLVYGYIGSVEKIVKEMKKELNDENCKVIATGGLGRVIANETDVIDLYDPDVAYKGMKIIYDRIKGKK